MPELAEVEFYRKEWNCGLKQKVRAVELHATKRIFRGTNTKLLTEKLPGATCLQSKAHGKQMLFRFSKDAWIGIHLGMTGKLRAEKRGFVPLKHDHFALRLKECTLVFSDPRQFGRVLFHCGKNEPPWWTNLPGEILSAKFNAEFVETFLRRHGRAPIKAVLLLQSGFPGIGNWMADEILWQSKVHPANAAGKLSPQKIKLVWKTTRFICEESLRTIGKDFSEPPGSWLFQYRWKKKGLCPRCRSVLDHASIGGRTTCWCPRCQPRIAISA